MSEKKLKPDELEKQPVVYRKQQFMSSVKYQEHKDLLEALLEEEKSYTLEEVRQIVETYQKGTVK